MSRSPYNIYFMTQKEAVVMLPRHDSKEVKNLDKDGVAPFKTATYHPPEGLRRTTPLRGAGYKYLAISI